MAISENIAQMTANSEWKLWAEHGWTLHPTPDGKVVAANVARRLATNRAKHLTALLKQLENDLFSDKQFLAFKRFHIPVDAWPIQIAVSADNSLHVSDKGGVMITPERITHMGLGVEWELWAEKGWTLHETPDDQVMAVNAAMRMATERAIRIATLISRLRKGTFGYKEFLDFRQRHTP